MSEVVVTGIGPLCANAAIGQACRELERGDIDAGTLAGQADAA
jgi:hypothetical protein